MSVLDISASRIYYRQCVLHLVKICEQLSWLNIYKVRMRSPLIKREAYPGLLYHSPALCVIQQSSTLLNGGKKWGK